MHKPSNTGPRDLRERSRPPLTAWRLEPYAVPCRPRVVVRLPRYSARCQTCWAREAWRQPDETPSSTAFRHPNLRCPRPEKLPRPELISLADGLLAARPVAQTQRTPRAKRQLSMAARPRRSSAPQPLVAGLFTFPPRAAPGGAASHAAALAAPGRHGATNRLKPLYHSPPGSLKHPGTRWARTGGPR